VYVHDHNGQDQVYRTALDPYMGWNGRASLEFTSPVWRWALPLL